MIIFNDMCIDTAKVVIIKTFIGSRTELMGYGKSLREIGLDGKEVIYISLYDKKPSSISVGDMREKYKDLQDFLRLTRANVVVDDTEFRENKNGKFKQVKGLVFDKIFGKNVDLWKNRGIFVKEGVKWLCGFRGESLGRECQDREVLDSEFVVGNLDKVEIREVTTLEGLLELKSFLEDADEVLFDIETNSLKFDGKGSNILCLQFGKRSEPYISYVVWYKKSGINVDSKYLNYVKKFIQSIAYTKSFVAHNGSAFDIPWICFHFELDVMQMTIIDTLVLTFIARNSTRKEPMDLKTLTFPIMSDYDSELDEFKAEYCASHKIKKEDFSYDFIPKDILVKYSAWDITALAFLLPQLEGECRNHIGGNLYDNVFVNYYKPYCNNVSYMMLNGVPFDVEKAKKWREGYREQLRELQTKLETDEVILKTEARLNQINYNKALEAYDKKVQEALAKGKTFKGKAPNFEDGKYGSIEFDIKFNPASANHKRVLFFDVLGLDIISTTESGASSVDSDTSNTLAKANPDIPVLGLFSNIAKLEKELTAFYDPYIEMAEASVDGRIRGSIRINGTISGRLSQTSPNILQVPSTSDFKKLISFPEDSDYYIIGSDIGNLEGNVATMLSGDKALNDIRLYADGDAHSYMGISLTNRGVSLFSKCKQGLDNTNIDDINFFKDNYSKERKIAKQMNFSCIFGIGANGLANDLDISVHDGQMLVEGFWETHSGLKAYFDDKENFAKENGYVRLAEGLCLLTPDANSEDRGLASQCIRSSNNATIQSHSSIAHRANMFVTSEARRLGLDMSPIIEIHDACYFQVRRKDLEEGVLLLEKGMCLPFMENQPYLLQSPCEISRNMKGGFEVKGNEEEKREMIREWLKDN